VTARLAAIRPGGWKMIVRRVAYVIGAVVAASGVAMIPPIIVSLIYREWATAGAIGLSCAITIAIGLFGWRVVGRSAGELTSKEGFAIVGVAWFVISLFGTLPYLLSGSIGNFTDAYFETASGFSTTGSSVIPDPGLLPHGILVWRSLTQWIGGMGIIVLSIAILPLLGVGGVQLARAESPGPQPDRLTPRFRETAKRLWLLYVAITVVEIVLLAAGEMDLFQAINHGFTTMSTGGFSTEAASIGAFGAYTQWVIIIFMFIAGTSFALHYRALRRPVEYVRHPEFRLYSAIAVGSFIIITGGLIANGTIDEKTIRDGAFTALTLITTTGYGTEDFTQWVSGLQIFAVGLFFVGGMAGSTAGGVKMFRIAVLTKAAHTDLRKLLHPKGVFVTRFGEKGVPREIVQSIQSFFLFYMFIFMTGTFLLAFISSNTVELDLVTEATAVASALGNIGPGLGDIGPAGNYLGIPWPGKWLLSFLMITGRLEIFPVVLLATRELWRR